MSKPYDASTKFLIEGFFPDWLALSPYPEVRDAEVIDADLSTVTAAADKVLKVLKPEPWILHLELQASRDDKLGERLHWYNALLEYRHGLPVHTLVVLLRREAASARFSEPYTRSLPGKKAYRWFAFQTLRLWESNSRNLLEGGLGLLPLATLTDDAAARLPEVLERIKERIEQEVSDATLSGTLWTATDILMGLRYDKAQIGQLLRGVFAMKESVTYQAIIHEGEVKAMKAMLRLQGEKKFGSFPTFAEQKLAETEDESVLQSWIAGVLDANSWEELLKDRF